MSMKDNKIRQDPEKSHKEHLRLGKQAIHWKTKSTTYLACQRESEGFCLSSMKVQLSQGVFQLNIKILCLEIQGKQIQIINKVPFFLFFQERSLSIKIIWHILLKAIMNSPLLANYVSITS